MDHINKLDSPVSIEKRLSDIAKRTWVRDQGRKRAIFVYVTSCNYFICSRLSNPTTVSTQIPPWTYILSTSSIGAAFFVNLQKTHRCSLAPIRYTAFPTGSSRVYPLN